MDRTRPESDSILAIDFGTTATAAAVWWRGQLSPLSFGESNWLSSAVFRSSEGNLLVGKAADRIAAMNPLAYEPTPKRRVGDHGAGVVNLAGHQLPAVELVAAVLGEVAMEAERQFPGIASGTVVLTHPARWARPRRAVLVEAAGRAGLSRPYLVPEPVAAAAATVVLAGQDGSSGAAGPEHPDRPFVCCVYDLGGGTFDVAVVTAAGGEMELAGRPGGVDPLGGVDFDRLLFDRVGALLAERDPDGWHRLTQADSRRSRADRRALLEEVRTVKESLSTQPSSHVFARGIDSDHAEILVTRDEFEALIRPLLDKTLVSVRDTLRRAGFEPTDLTALCLTGGSSRIPAVHDMLWRELGVAPATQGEPKLIVPLGAVTAHRHGLTRRDDVAGEEQARVDDGGRRADRDDGKRSGGDGRGSAKKSEQDSVSEEQRRREAAEKIQRDVDEQRHRDEVAERERQAREQQEEAERAQQEEEQRRRENKREREKEAQRRGDEKRDQENEVQRRREAEEKRRQAQRQKERAALSKAWEVGGPAGGILASVLYSVNQTQGTVSTDSGLWSLVVAFLAPFLVGGLVGAVLAVAGTWLVLRAVRKP